MGAVLAALVRGSFAAEMRLGLDLREGEGDCLRIAEAGQCVDPGAAGIGEAQKLGDFVERFAGGIVEGAADERVVPGSVGWFGEIEMRVTAGDDER